MKSNPCNLDVFRRLVLALSILAVPAQVRAIDLMGVRDGSTRTGATELTTTSLSGTLTWVQALTSKGTPPPFRAIVAGRGTADGTAQQLHIGVLDAQGRYRQFYKIEGALCRQVKRMSWRSPRAGKHVLDADCDGLLGPNISPDTSSSIEIELSPESLRAEDQIVRVRCESSTERGRASIRARSQRPWFLSTDQPVFSTKVSVVPAEGARPTDIETITSSASGDFRAIVRETGTPGVKTLSVVHATGQFTGRRLTAGGRFFNQNGYRMRPNEGEDDWEADPTSFRWQSVERVAPAVMTSTANQLLRPGFDGTWNGDLILKVDVLTYDRPATAPGRRLVREETREFAVTVAKDGVLSIGPSDRKEIIEKQNRDRIAAGRIEAARKAADELRERASLNP